jgi:hypothetical protein
LSLVGGSVHVKKLHNSRSVTVLETPLVDLDGSNSVKCGELLNIDIYYSALMRDK